METSDWATASLICETVRFSGTSTSMPPKLTMWLATWIPISSNNRLATAPTATRIVVSRADDLSKELRKSSKRYLIPPTKSAWPGRGLVIFRSPFFFSSTSLTDMISSHFWWSRLVTFKVMGPPMVNPWRTPEVISTWSLSIFIRAPRP